jgi:Na+-translocating ferredoxin:NAD+ oxidoreductase RnfD subunit
MNSLRMGIDGISQATPLDTFKTISCGGNQEVICTGKEISRTT